MGSSSVQEVRGVDILVSRKARGKRLSMFVFGFTAIGMVLARSGSSWSSAANAPTKPLVILRSFSLGFFTSGTSGVG